jgi:Mannosylglycerate hydrolase MGH1-like glycoside hydrolase domain
MVIATGATTAGGIDHDRLARAAVRVLIENWRGHATVPSRSLYPHQWSWDSAFIALGLEHFTPRRAAAELLSLFGAQWSDGRIPHIAFNPAVADDAYFPGPSFWRSVEIDGHPPIDTSGIIQPPVHALAAAAVVQGLGQNGPAFADRVYPYLVAQNSYLRQRRTVGELAAVVHPWETGLDNLPTWDAPLHAVPSDLSLFTIYTRRDLDHAAAGERPTDEDYSRYIRLALAYRDCGYGDDWVRQNGEFLVVDPAFNALWARSELALAEIARSLGRDPDRHLAEAERITAAVVDHLWSEGRGVFLARDETTTRLLPERTVAGLIPLILPGLPAQVVTALCETLAGDCFGAGREGVRGVPSFDLTDPRYDPQRYWRGPTWLNTTWLVASGLALHGKDALAQRLRDDMVALVANAGLREYFNPHTGSGHGTTNFSWSAALLLHVLASGSMDRG